MAKGGYGPGALYGMGGSYLTNYANYVPGDSIVGSIGQQTVIIAPTQSLALINDGTNTIGIDSSAASQGVCELYIEFFDRLTRRSVDVGFKKTALTGQVVWVNDLPRYWYGKVLIPFAGDHCAPNPFSFTPNSVVGTDTYEVIPDTTITIPDPTQELS